MVLLLVLGVVVAMVLVTAAFFADTGLSSPVHTGMLISVPMLSLVRLILNLESTKEAVRNLATLNHTEAYVREARDCVSAQLRSRDISPGDSKMPVSLMKILHVSGLSSPFLCEITLTKCLGIGIR